MRVGRSGDGFARSSAQGSPTVIKAVTGDTPEIVGPGASGRVRFGDVDLNATPRPEWIEIRDFGIRDFQSPLFIWFGHNITVDNMTLSRSAFACLAAQRNSTNITFTNNTLTDCGETHAGSGEGIYIGKGTSSLPNDQTEGVLIKGNTITDLAGECMDIKSGTRDITIEDNIISGCNSNNANGAAVMIQPCDNGFQDCGRTDDRNIIIQRNTLFDFSRMSSPTTTSGFRCDGNCIVRNNVIYGLQATQQAAIGRGTTGADANEMYVYHNTINPGSMTAADVILKADPNMTDACNIEGVTAGTNLAYDSAFFTDAASNDYTLLNGTVDPADPGNCTTPFVTHDFLELDRDGDPDTGAYEFAAPAQSTPVITTTSITTAAHGVAYSATLVATQGTEPYTWTNNGAGTTLNDSDPECVGLTISTAGVVSGTPTFHGVCSWTALVTDNNSNTDTQALTVTIGPIQRLRLAEGDPTNLLWEHPDATQIVRFGVSYDNAPFLSAGRVPHPTLAGVFVAAVPALIVGLHSIRIRACNAERCSEPPHAEVQVQVDPPPLPVPAGVDPATIRLEPRP